MVNNETNSNSNNEELNIFIKNTNSILSDDKKILKIINLILKERNVNYTAPESFEQVDGSVLAHMITIDSLQQKKIISRDFALELIADLFENYGCMKKQEEIANNILLKKYKDLYLNYRIKMDDLLYELNVGRINQKEFLVKYKNIIEWKNNSLMEMNETTNVLTKSRKKR